MKMAYSKRRFLCGHGSAAVEAGYAAAPVVLPSSILRSDVHILSILPAIGLAFLLSQGCAAMGVALLGGAATTATKAGVSYTLDSRAQKTFTAPMNQVKSSLLAALGEMAFPITSEEKQVDGERLVAGADGREVQVELEPVTPKATKVTVIVHQGWFWKDRATAEEIIDQTGRGVEAVVQASKPGGVGAAGAARKTSGEAELRPTAVLLDPWDPQRWREGFAAAPTPTPVPKRGPEPAAVPVSAAAAPRVALGGGREPAPDSGLPSAVRVKPAVATVGAPPSGGKSGDGEDNRWRVIRTVRLRTCPGKACGWGAPLKRGDVVVRLREKDQWWRVWLAGTDVVGWVLTNDLAPQQWWDPAARPIAASLR